MSDKPVIPIFPLSLVVLPGELRPLHIFEERYKAMIAYCRERESVFGISASRGNEVSNVGCAVEITRITQEYDDGRLDILTVGSRRYRVIEVYQDQPYLTATVDFFEDEPEQVDPELRQRARSGRARFFELMGEPGWSLEERDVPDDSFGLTRGIDLPLEFKQQLLESGSEQTRLELLCDQFSGLIPELAQKRETVNKARSNGRAKGL